MVRSKRGSWSWRYLGATHGRWQDISAVYFTCRELISDGAKVLWLAHTHHLLEQAYSSFASEVGLIAESKSQLNVRLVSGMGGDHFPIHSVKPTDDVVISSLPTACRAIKEGHSSLTDFLAASNGNLLVVFDEAHHAPAPSYRDLLRELRRRFPRMTLLGLTATPTYGNESKAGWLLELFPQGIVHQVTANELMLQGILARPVFHEERTQFSPDFSERDYKLWLGTHRDVPEDIVTALATNQERNDYIIATYADKREKWGKTLIFADRWFQCEYLREGLAKRGIRVEAVYNHVGGSLGTVEERNRHAPDHNSKVLKAFKSNSVDVLINVKMLTEGTDVPDVQTVFLTRQTTSRILLTQMVGRALRGPKFGGTAEAHIVCFIDDWKQRIDWAAFDQLATGPADEELRELRKRPPVHLISIDLVRRLARQMDSGSNVNSMPYRLFLPIGWYVVQYKTRVAGTDDEVDVNHSVIVFEHQASKFLALLADLNKEDLGRWREYDLDEDTLNPELRTWYDRHFAGGVDHIGTDLPRDIMALVRHMAQNDRQHPRYVPFDARDKHDLDGIARIHYDTDLGIRESLVRIRKEYDRKDRQWNLFYPRFEQFKSAYDGCINRIDAVLTGGLPLNQSIGFTNPEATPDREPSEEVKRAVKVRDGKRCLCCGCTSPLQVDHIDSFYRGGTHDPDNLQTLCKHCNNSKGTVKVDFRVKKSPLKEPLRTMPEYQWCPTEEAVREPEQWEFYIRASFNLFYRAAVVATVEIGQRGERFHHWQVKIKPGNDTNWLAPFLDYFVKGIRAARENAGLSPAPQDITVEVSED